MNRLIGGRLNPAMHRPAVFDVRESADAGRFDGLELRTTAWKVEPTEIVRAHSSYFTDEASFPPGSATLDSALIMRRVPVTWAALPALRATR